MGLDRVVCFPESVPSTEEVLGVCEDFFDSAATVELDRGTVFVKLAGMNSYALTRYGGATRAQRAYWREVKRGSSMSPNERWIELWPSEEPPAWYITTRQHDEYTNALAQGLLEVLKRGWGGEEHHD